MCAAKQTPNEKNKFPKTEWSVKSKRAWWRHGKGNKCCKK